MLEIIEQKSWLDLYKSSLKTNQKIEEFFEADNSIRKTVGEDISLRNSSKTLWQLHESKPDIKQIYGHFLPPLHRNLVEGLVAKDFNFPSAYHAANDLNKLMEIYAKCIDLKSESVVSLNTSVKLRAEGEGAIVYTQYFNGYYMNQQAFEILKCCEDEISVMNVASQSGYQLDSVREFLTRALMLGIIDASIS